MPDRPIEPDFLQYHIRTFVRPVAPAYMLAFAILLFASTLAILLFDRNLDKFTFLSLPFSIAALIIGIVNARAPANPRPRNIRLTGFAFILIASTGTTIIGLRNDIAMMGVVAGCALACMGMLLFWATWRSFLVTSAFNMGPPTIAAILSIDDPNILLTAILFSVGAISTSTAVMRYLLPVMKQNHRLALEVWERANRDGMTGTYNRAHCFSVGQALIDQGETIAVLFIDLDHFKHVNDTYGHEEGDEVLTRAAQLIAKTACDGATVSRFGGDEFCVLVPGRCRHTATKLAQQICDRLAALRAPDGPITSSIGVAWSGPGESFGDVVRRADAALLSAKREGRNRVVVSQSTPAGTPVISMELARQVPSTRILTGTTG